MSQRHKSLGTKIGILASSGNDLIGTKAEQGVLGGWALRRFTSCKMLVKLQIHMKKGEGCQVAE